ncbi:MULTISPECIES: extracellular solute-binding protein [unclassified Terrabacter]|uniref:extracellular solute-binding protein n=1 Tax=unclassified Terrabacter TaxID=2630222 RepID=UPI0006F693D1|nr:MULTISPECIES: extracellular solute-binding protein [unclassified Terrabacter]KRB47511.1 sugar ABC transporter sugar-binding protein [Terrabacter sp. Root181]KRF35584.1 sugar ABC transporter sugar-binding protein [Terrabacter sp. Soil810]
MTFASRLPGSSRRARRTVLTIAALSGALVVTACSPSSSGSSSTGDDGKVTLTVWSWRVEDEAAYTKIFDAYEKAHPGVSIDFKAFKATEYNKILATGLAGSSGPDVPQVRSYGQLQGTVASKSLLPLDGKVDLAGWDENVVASAKGKEDGKTYSVPLARQTVQMFYNQGLFDKSGIKAPTTWAEFIAANDKLMAAGVTPIAIGAKDDWTLPIVHEVLAAPRFGGKAFQSEVLSGQKSFTDPDWVGSVQVVSDLEKYLPKNSTGVAQTDAQTLFSAEKAAMIPGGSFDLSVFQKANPAMKIGIFQVPPAPGSPSGSAATTAGWADGNFGVSARSKHPTEATELVKWMTTKEFGQMVTDDIRQISAVPGVEPTDPLLKQMSQNYTDSGSPYLLLTDFRYGSPTGTDLLGKGLQELLLGSKDATAVSQDLETGVKTWFKPSA